MKRAELAAGVVYSCSPYKYAQPYPVRLLSVALWRRAVEWDRFELDPTAQRPTAYVGMLVVQHTDTTLNQAEDVAALARLPYLDLTTPASYEATLTELPERVATHQAALPAGMQLAVVNNRNLLRTWTEWQTVRDQAKSISDTINTGRASSGHDRLDAALGVIRKLTGASIQAENVDRDGPYARLDVEAAELLAGYLSRKG